MGKIRMTACSGGAYVTVVVVGMALFLLLSGAMAVSAYSRRITGHYAQYTGMYDLALAGNERAFFLLLAHLEQERTAIEEKARNQALSQIENHLVYRNGRFHLAFPENRYFAALFQQEANKVLQAYIQENDAWTHWSASAAYTHDNEPLTEIYTATTQVLPNHQRFILHTTIHKSVNGQQGFPTEVTAEIVWPVTHHQELFIPRHYSWKNMPAHFDLYKKEGGLNTVIDITLLEALHMHDEKGLVITNAPFWDIMENTPMVLIHTGENLVIQSSGVNNQFTGLIISLGNVTLDGINLRGAIWAETVTAFNGSMTPDSAILFEIPLSQPAQQDLFDFLRLTSFSETKGPTSDIQSILGRLRFAREEGIPPGEIILNNFDGYAPTMVKSKRIFE